MKYKIYSLEYPEHLQTTEYRSESISRAVLQNVNVGWENEFKTIEDAYKHIYDNSEQLSGYELCILPVMKIDYDGNLI